MRVGINRKLIAAFESILKYPNSQISPRGERLRYSIIEEFFSYVFCYIKEKKEMKSLYV